MPSPRPAPGYAVLDAIIDLVASEFAVPRRVLCSHRRNAGAVEARQAGMWLARHVTRQSYPAIGRAFDRDHTSVIYAVSRIEQLMQDDETLAVRVQRLRAAIEAVIEAFAPPDGMTASVSP